MLLLGRVFQVRRGICVVVAETRKCTFSLIHALFDPGEILINILFHKYFFFYAFVNDVRGVVRRSKILLYADDLQIY